VGGNLFKTKRIDLVEYNELCDDIKIKLNTMYKTFEVIPAYINKKTFGDIDVLVLSNEGNNYNNIINLFNPEDIHNNNPIITIKYKDVQIDFILCNSIELFNSSLFYFSYNDLGNLLGRIYHKFGIKFGHDGLFYIYNYLGKKI